MMQSSSSAQKSRAIQKSIDCAGLAADRFVKLRTVEVHVGRLRTKLGPVSNQIETVFELGYRFVELADQSSVCSVGSFCFFCSRAA